MPLLPSSADPKPSILDHPLKEDASKSEPSTKRPRLSDESSAPTIASKLYDGVYDSLSHLVDDVDTIASELLAPFKDREASLAAADPTAQPSAEDAQASAKILAFQKLLKTHLEQNGEQFNKPTTNGATTEVNGAGSSTESKDTVPAAPQEATQVKKENQDSDSAKETRAVLSVFATAPTARQLFSSYQRAVVLKDQPDSSGLKGVTEVVIPLREKGLPNFISVSKLPPPEKKPKHRGLPIGKRLPTPRTVPQIQLPKPPGNLTTKSSTVDWVSDDKLAKIANHSSRQYNYCQSKLSTAKWLSWGGVDPALEPSSPEEKRKQRDRALSTGSAQTPRSEASVAALEEAKTEALFRQAYHSFVPQYDNGNAVVAHHTLGDIWWNKLGQERARRLFGEFGSSSAYDEDEEEKPTHLEEEAIEFKEFVDNLDNIDPALLQGPPPPEGEEKSEEDKEVDDLLHDINDLIETLYAYQRVRLSQLPSLPVTPVGPKPSSADFGTPSTPSETELETYKMLKEQLALLVLQLPPHAIARLNGDQLEELNVSTSIIVETDDSRGLMDTEDTAQPYSRPAAAQTPQQLPPRGSGNYSNFPPGSQFARSAAQLQSRNAAYIAHQQLQPAARTPSWPAQRANSGVQTFAGGYPTTGGRPGYSQGYNPATPRPVTGYGQATPGISGYSRPQAAGAANYAAYFQQGQQGTPQQHQQMRQQFPQTPGTNYSYRPQSGTASFTQQTAPSPQMRTASPLQAAGAAASPLNRYQQLGTPIQRPQFASNPQASAVGPSGFYSTMSAQEQQMMMERQRALAQSHSRLNAQGQLSGGYASMRQGSGTPQPPNGQHASQVNGTPAPTQT
jgi:hypothetical protein